MTDLKVDGPGVANLVQSLRDAADQMRQATSALSAASTSGLGHADLDAAAGHFAHEWGYGIGQLNKASTNVANQLEDGIRGYDQTDTELAGQIRKAMPAS